MDDVSVMKTKIKSHFSSNKTINVNSVRVEEIIYTGNLCIINQAACKSFTYHSITGSAIQRERNVLRC